MIRGIRGATSVEVDDRDAVLEATAELLREVLERNGVDDLDRVSSAFFTTTPDLVSCFPAEAARGVGFGAVPLLCASEIDVAGALPRLIRVLLHVDTTLSQKDVQHVYLHRAKALRPDLGEAQ
ncbi:chorismate mutase [Alienimonas chondri]|uniref:chorismate mutase n=1 Tax=Alienimonas chondri TaxID=2681879 RepID=A0ABX1VCA5_9PLAN|nr:chorismate mutase [Alienimonas chondri]NNJ25734.1 Chorismate mutase AroH [Alienimonas chondri]